MRMRKNGKKGPHREAGRVIVSTRMKRIIAVDYKAGNCYNIYPIT